MADVDQAVSAIKGSSGPVTQRWKEWITGIYARTQAALLYGISSGGSSEIAIKASSGGAVYAELQPSTEVVGLLGASTAMIGHAILDASTAAIGLAGGHTRLISAALAPTTSQAYAGGDLMGSAAVELANVFRSTSVMTGLLESIVVADKTTAQAPFDFVLFGTATTGTTYTNDAAFTPADGDLSKIVGHAQVYQGDYAAFADNGVATVKAIGLVVTATTGTSLFVAPVLRSTPSYVTTGDLRVTFGFLVD